MTRTTTAPRWTRLAVLTALRAGRWEELIEVAPGLDDAFVRAGERGKKHTLPDGWAGDGNSYRGFIYSPELDALAYALNMASAPLTPEAGAALPPASRPTDPVPPVVEPPPLGMTLVPVLDRVAELAAAIALGEGFPHGWALEVRHLARDVYATTLAQGFSPAICARAAAAVLVELRDVSVTP